jgi:xanthine/CO dehydrogenase XdhC/CoxF family maturation factor
MRFLLEVIGSGRPSALVVVTDVERRWSRGPGKPTAVTADGARRGSLSGGRIETAVVGEAPHVMESGRAERARFVAGSRIIDIRLPCDGSVHLLNGPTPSRRSSRLLWRACPCALRRPRPSHPTVPSSQSPAKRQALDDTGRVPGPTPYAAQGAHASKISSKPRGRKVISSAMQYRQRRSQRSRGADRRSCGRVPIRIVLPRCALGRVDPRRYARAHWVRRLRASERASPSPPETLASPKRASHRPIA